MSKLSIRLLNFLETRWGITIIRKETRSILDRPYETVVGTIRQDPDYDDAWLLALAQEAKKVFDIGCNMGQSTLILMHPGTIQKIVLVDPNPTALSIAAQNLILNGLSAEAHFVCAFAAAQANQVVQFFTVGAGAAGSMYASHARTAKSLGNQREVPTVTIDRLCATYNWIPDLVKIDTEGAESLVLQGATQLAANQGTRFFVEMHSNQELTMAENAQRILGWCQENDYRAWYLKEKNVLEKPEQIARRGRCHLLLLPSGEALPAALKDLEQGGPLEKVAMRGKD